MAMPESGNTPSSTLFDRKQDVLQLVNVSSNAHLERLVSGLLNTVDASAMDLDAMRDQKSISSHFKATGLSPRLSDLHQP